MNNALPTGPADKKRISCRIGGDSLAVYERVLVRWGTNAAGDLLRRWVLSGVLVWSREGGQGRLEDMGGQERARNDVVERKRVSCRLNGRLPEDRHALGVYDRVLDEWGTYTAGDLLRRWVLAGFQVWVREGGRLSLDAFDPSDERAAARLEPMQSCNNENNTPSNNDGVLSNNEQLSGGANKESSTEIGPAPPSPPPRPTFVGMLGMGLSQEVRKQ